MAYCPGNYPCKYSDCLYYVEDCADYQYREHPHCGKCKNMLHHIKPSKNKESNKVDRFEPISRIKPDNRLSNYLFGVE
jgi:hypothetical protein